MCAGDAGGASVTVPTLATGHAQVFCQLGPDAGQNIIEANYPGNPGNPGNPATFVLYGVTRDLSKPTSLTGLVLDNTSQPIGNALCEIFIPGSASPVLITYSDTQGRFTFPNTPVGPADLFIYGPSATSLGTNKIPPNSFPFLSYPITLIPNAENSPRFTTTKCRCRSRTVLARPFDRGCFLACFLALFLGIIRAS